MIAQNSTYAKRVCGDDSPVLGFLPVIAIFLP
jgi:hypothetical protein